MQTIMNSHLYPLFCATALALCAAIPARADWVLDWNNAALVATQATGDSSAVASRSLAILHAAVYDAITAIDGGFTPYHAMSAAPSGADQRAAVAAAANTVMGALYPTLGSSFATIYNDELATIGSSQAKTDGINWGNQVATEILNARQSDGASNAASTPYNPSGQIGRWAPTPNSSSPALNYQNPPTLPGWNNVTPFVMASGFQMRPGAPPDLTSAAYALAYNQVLSYGAKVGSLRTLDQTAQAYFWADQPGQFTQVAHWNQIAANLMNAVDLRTEARVMAALNVTLADAGITAWDAKYFYDTWRPITAIAYADSDGNPATASDIFWEPLLDSQPTPEYLNEVSSFSAAAGEILKHYFGDVGISVLGDSDGNGTYDTVRNYGSISDAVLEAGMSGIYAGDHFGFADAAGRTAGAGVAGLTISGPAFQPIAPVPEPSSMIFVALAGVLSIRRRRV